MESCFLCGNAITEKSVTEEHILLQSLGGHLVSKKIICRDCNSKMGERIDAPLANQLSFLVFFLKINRDRGVKKNFVMKENESGDEYIISQGGVPKLKHPVVTDESDSDKIKINCKFNSLDELEKYADKFTKRNPEITKEKILKSAKENVNIGSVFKKRIVLGGKEVFPSILKTAIEFAIYCDVPIALIQKSITVLKKSILGEEINSSNCNFKFLPQRNIFPINDGEWLHSVYLCKKKSNLYVFVTYFSFYTMVVKLERNYAGSDIEKLYVYDVINRKEVYKQVIDAYISDLFF